MEFLRFLRFLNSMTINLHNIMIMEVVDTNLRITTSNGAEHNISLSVDYLSKAYVQYLAQRNIVVTQKEIKECLSQRLKEIPTFLIERFNRSPNVAIFDIDEMINNIIHVFINDCFFNRGAKPNVEKNEKECVN